MPEKHIIEEGSIRHVVSYSLVNGRGKSKCSEPDCELNAMPDEKPFARVEEMEHVTEVGAAPYFKLIAANIVVSEGYSFEELQEMADALNSHAQEKVKEAMERCAKGNGVELKEIESVLCDVAQVFDGWAADDPKNWTDHDRSVRKRLSDIHTKIYAEIRRLMREEGK